MLFTHREGSYFCYFFADTNNIKEVPNGNISTPQKKGQASHTSLESVTNSSYLFAEKLVSVLVDLFLQAPATEKYNIYPETIQGLGR